jgi:hypothetical protein
MLLINPTLIKVRPKEFDPVLGVALLGYHVTMHPLLVKGVHSITRRRRMS